jgi:hypothetical protein
MKKPALGRLFREAGNAAYLAASAFTLAFSSRLWRAALLR